MMVSKLIAVSILVPQESRNECINRKQEKTSWIAGLSLEMKQVLVSLTKRKFPALLPEINSSSIVSTNETSIGIFDRNKNSQLSLEMKILGILEGNNKSMASLPKMKSLNIITPTKSLSIIAGNGEIIEI